MPANTGTSEDLAENRTFTALDTLRQEGDDVAIATDVPMVGYLAPLLLACVNQGFHAEGLVAAIGYAVHDEILHNF